MDSSSSFSSSSVSSSISTRALSSSSSSVSSSSSTSSSSTESSSSSSEINGTFLQFVTEGVVWNKSKFVSSETAFICSSIVGNKLAQTVGVNSLTYKIGRISLFLREKQGSSTEDFTIFVEVFETDSNGLPKTSITASSKKSSEINWTGWHTFDFSMEEQTTPPSKKISIVVWQDGGDEDNYVSWLYSSGAKPGAKALYSSDFGTTWSESLNTVRLIKIVKPYNPFSTLCSNGLLKSSVAEELIVNFSNFDEQVNEGGAIYNGVHNGTITEQNETSEGSDSFDGQSDINNPLIISNKNLIASLIVDNSGSMGWNDRGKNKKLIAEEIVNQLKEKYPGNAVFDFIKFGSTGLGFSISGGGASYATIKLDPNQPSSVTNNNDGTTPTIEDDIVACGFSKLESGHSYVLQSVTNGTTTLFNGFGLIDQNLGIRITENVQNLGHQSNPIRFSIQSLGTGSESGAEGTFSTIAEVPTSGSTQIRKPTVSGRVLITSELTEKLLEDRTRAFVSDASVFEVGETVDFVDTYGSSCSHSIIGVGTNFIDFSPVAAKDFGIGQSNMGGFVQQSSALNTLNIDPDSMIELLVKDSESSRQISFYVETSKGGKFEWVFTAMTEWLIQYLTYIDRPFDLVTYFYDQDGKEMPPNSRVKYYVDEKPRWKELEKKIEIWFDQPVLFETGDDTIHLSNVDGIHLNDKVTLISSNNKKFEGYFVYEIDDVELFIRITPPNLEDDFMLSGVIFVKQVSKNLGKQFDLTFCGVDVSAAKAQRFGTNRLSSDKTQVDLSQSNFNVYNQDRTRWIYTSFDIPSVRIDGSENACASVHLMPITDDCLNTLDEESIKAESYFNNSALTNEERMELESLENQYLDLLNEQPSQIINPVATKVELDSEDLGVNDDKIGPDWVLSPTEAKIGYITKFTSSSSDLTMQRIEQQSLYFDMTTKSSASENGLLAKLYKVYPAIFVKDNNNNTTSRFLLEPYPVYFVSPVHIFSQPEVNKTVRFSYECETEDGAGTCVTDVPGVYATSGEDIQIDYMVYHRGKRLDGAKLRIKIYDAFRTQIQNKINPWETTPSLEKEFGGDEPKKFNKQTFVKLQLNESGEYIQNIDTQFETYYEAVYLEGYIEGGYEVDLVRGSASIVIPAIDVVTRLIVKVEVVCPDNESMSCTRYDSIWIKNPLELSVLTRGIYIGGYDIPPFEAKVKMTLFGEPIPDNVSIQLYGSEHDRYKSGDSGKIDPNSSFGQTLNRISNVSKSDAMKASVNSLLINSSRWPATPVKPSVGKTINGTASGFMIGSHGPVIMHQDPDSEYGEYGEMIGDRETLYASASYQPPNSRGPFSVFASQEIEWTGAEETVDAYIHTSLWKNGVKIGANASGYSDGWDTLTLVVDAPASKNRFFTYFDDQSLSDDLIGKTRPSKTGREVWIDGIATKFSDTRPIDPTTNLPMGEFDQTGEGLECVGWASANITYCGEVPEPPPGADAEDKCIWPPCKEYKIIVAAMLPTGKGSVLQGCAGDDLSSCAQYNVDGSKIPNNVKVTWADPLNTEYWCNGKKLGSPFNFIRDGVTQSEIWISTTFSGQPIPLVAHYRNVKDANGIRPPMPQVFTYVTYLHQEWDENGKIIPEKTYEFEDPSLTLTDYSPYVSVCRTTTEEQHYHSCEVDDITGNGITVKTFAAESLTEITNHIHTVSNFVLSDSLYNNGIVHTHSPMSVAITKLNPVSNITSNICLHSTFSYDASKKAVSRTKSFSKCTELEWFDCWEMDLAASQRGEVQARTEIQDDVETTDIGLTVSATLKHKVNGNYVSVPDGIRVSFDVKAYEPTSDEDEEDNIPTFDMSQDTPVTKMILSVTAIAFVNGSPVIKNLERPYYSSLKWIPKTTTLVDEPTNDNIYIQNALAKIDDVKGTSPIYDAIVLASDRINIYNTNNLSTNKPDSFIAVLTDGCENKSQRNLDTVISRLKQIANDDRKPFVVILLFGSPSQSDVILIEKIKSDTGGIMVRIPIGYDPSLITQMVSEIFSMGSNSFNSGSYIGTVDIGGNEEAGGISEQNGTFKQACIDIDLPIGSLSSFSCRFSSDKDSWTKWTNPVNLTSPAFCVTLPDHKCRYMQYIIRMYGNSGFESPKISNVKITYLKPSTDVIFMQPISIDTSFDDYVSETVLTHNADIPEGGEIKYGSVNNDTTNEVDYGKNEKPWFNANERSILLTRMNEPAYIINQKTYQALNGSWPDDATVEVFVIPPKSKEGIKVKPESYTTNNQNGTISFLSPLENGSRVIIDVKPDKIVRTAIRMVNYSKEPIKINQMTMMFNKTKRINRKVEGTIIRQTITDYLDESSSSLSSESSNSQ